MKTILIILAALAAGNVYGQSPTPTPTPTPAPVAIASQPTPAPAPAPIVITLNAATTQALLTVMLAGIQAALPSGESLPAMPPLTQVQALNAMVFANGGSQATITFSATPLVSGTTILTGS